MLSKSMLATATAIAVVAITVLAGSAAYAAGDFADLDLDPSACTDGDEITLTEDITGGVLTISCDLTLDLNGHTLSTDGVVITAGNALTILDSDEAGGELIATAAVEGAAGIQNTDALLTVNGGTVRARGRNSGAGIGGSAHGDGGTVTINGGTVDARGGFQGAGIGGGNRGGGGTVTVNGGTVDARGGFEGAGIGSGFFGEASSVTIDGGTVHATGGFEGAGIGGARAASGATIVIRGGTVHATGGSEGAGIGSGAFGEASSVTIDGGTVHATGDLGGAGIGGGRGGRGGAVLIGGGAVVTASASAASAVGGGHGSAQFGSLTLNGTLHIPSGGMHLPDGAVVEIGATGQLLGHADTPTTGSTVTGTGHINNHGVIALDESLVQVSVTGHNYDVEFDTTDADESPPDQVRVFAPDFDSGYRTLPTAPAGTNWFADTGHTAFSATTPLDTTAVDGHLKLRAFIEADLALTAPTNTVNQGDSLTFTLSATDSLGNAIDTTGAYLTSDVATDIIDGLTVTFPEASPHTITAHLGVATTTFTVEVMPASDDEPSQDPDEPSEPADTQPPPDPEIVPEPDATSSGRTIPATGNTFDPFAAATVALTLIGVGAALTAAIRTRRYHGAHLAP